MDVAVATATLPPYYTSRTAPANAPHSTATNATAIAIATRWQHTTTGIRWRQQQPPTRLRRTRRTNQTTRVYKITKQKVACARDLLLTQH